MAETLPTMHRTRVRRWIILAVKLLIVVILLWLVRGTIQQSWTYLREHPRPMHGEWLVLAAGLYLLALLPEGLFWLWALRALGQDVRAFDTLRAYYIGHLGKYAPGKAMVVVLRTALIHSHRVNTGVVVASVFLETLTMMAVGAFIAVPVLMGRYSDNPLFLLAAAGTAAVAGLPTLPPVFSRLAKLLGVGRSAPDITEKLAGFDYGVLFRGWLAMVFGWIAMGASLWAVLRGLELPASFDRLWYLYTAITAMAVVLGFAAIVLPAGAVAREAVFAVLLGPLLQGTEPAVIVAVALRLTWLLAELAISGILYCAGWMKLRS